MQFDEALMAEGKKAIERLRSEKAEEGDQVGWKVGKKFAISALISPEANEKLRSESKRTGLSISKTLDQMILANL